MTPALSLVLLLALSAPPDGPVKPPAHEGSQDKGQEPAKTQEPAKDKKPSWRVEEPPGPTETIPFDVTEGTWLNVDVSPDGQQLAFDLLGDLYVLPIGGGTARAVTSGMAWDMQPRFSPDGRRLVFTSDRGGGDNVWTIALDGTDAKAITSESFRLLNSPVWRPDGEYIAARKHFTAERSLGAGEIWLYHRSGGGGTPLTTKKSEQKDTGEPAFSPDGKSLYYSFDTSPGANFEYNKDPNGQIYAINRVDLLAGRTETVVGGPGGAIRPTPSPDGKHLAFVRRLRGQSALWLLDLTTGDERVLHEGLDRDMQETWAIHGVYPSMAWLPDSASIVYWAKGTFHRTRLDGSTTDIPFRVTDARRVSTALRFPVDVAPERFPVRALSGVRVSPDGGHVVYQALGLLWLKALPDGAPRRLTNNEDRIELAPTWSRDGRRIAFATWNDQALGDVRIVDADGGSSRVVISEPGHWTEPVFSPDGKTLVVRKGTGGGLVSPLRSADPGLYRVAVDGKRPPQLVWRDGEAPHFGANGQRLYFLGHEGKSVALESIDLDTPVSEGAETHLTFHSADRAQVSPDGKYVVFSERYRTFLTVFPPLGRARDVGPKSDDLPVARLSKDTGEAAQWANGRIYWASGPELFSRRVEEAFAWVPGAVDPLPPLPDAGTPIGFQAEADIPRGAIAIVGATLVTMRGGAPDSVIPDGTLVIEKNRITAVGPRLGTPVPAGAHIVDGKGLTAIPGLIDVHMHGAQGEDGVTPQSSYVDLAHLAFGVTTVHDPSNGSLSIFTAAERQRTGDLLAPRIFSTGTILYGADASITAQVDSLDDALAHLRRQKALGAISVKSYNQPRRDQRQQIIAAARDLHMMVVPEGGSLLQHNLTQVVDGHTGIEHAIPVERVYADLLAFWPKTGVGWTPTFNVAYGGIMGENYWYTHTKVYENARLRRFVPNRELDQASRRRVLAPESEYNHIAVARIAKAFVDAGGKVQVGAHGQREGLGAHWEMWSLVQGGMTPFEAIRAATLAGAQYLGMDKDLGSLEPGKLADIDLIAGDPLSDIRTTEHVRYVIVNGRLYDADTLEQLAPDHVLRKPLYFESSPGLASPTGAGHGDGD